MLRNLGTSLQHPVKSAGQPMYLRDTSHRYPTSWQSSRLIWPPLGRRSLGPSNWRLSRPSSKQSASFSSPGGALGQSAGHSRDINRQIDPSPTPGLSARLPLTAQLEANFQRITREPLRSRSTTPRAWLKTWLRLSVLLGSLTALCCMAHLGGVWEAGEEEAEHQSTQIS